MKTLVGLLAITSFIPTLAMAQAPGPAGPPAVAPPAKPAAPLVGPGMAEPPPQGKDKTWSGRFMPRELAVEAATTALDACKARGAHVTVTVSDSTGYEHVFITDDGAKIVAAQASRKKAKMTASTMRATADTVGNPAYQQIIRDVLGDDVINVSGAQPIWVGDEMIGVISVGGRGGPEENWCALEGIKKIQSRLK